MYVKRLESRIKILEVWRLRAIVQALRQAPRDASIHEIGGGMSNYVENGCNLDPRGCVHAARVWGDGRASYGVASSPASATEGGRMHERGGRQAGKQADQGGGGLLLRWSYSIGFLVLGSYVAWCNHCLRSCSWHVNYGGGCIILRGSVWHGSSDEGWECWWVLRVQNSKSSEVSIVDITVVPLPCWLSIDTYYHNLYSSNPNLKLKLLIFPILF